jgi:hypothetical protein
MHDRSIKKSILMDAGCKKSKGCVKKTVGMEKNYYV